MKYWIKIWHDGTNGSPEFLAFSHDGPLSDLTDSYGRVIANGGLITVMGDSGKHHSIPGRRVLRIDVEEIR